MNKTWEFIESNWDACIRENRFDGGTLIGIPYPYTVPSTEQGCFNELYYWDTYFTNVGLLKTGKAMLAKQNVDNMLYLVNKYGFMPNGTRTWYLTRSQPPFLSEMVKDVYDYYKDDIWLIGAYQALKKEYLFWMEKRISPIGLNVYSPEFDSESADDMAEMFLKRTRANIKDSKNDIARHAMSSSESGWDMNPRFGFEGHHFAAIDLNSLLFGMENNMAFFAEKLGYNDDTAKWKFRSGKRVELMNKYLVNDKELFFDYNFKTGQHSKIFSSASYYPLFTKAASKNQAKAAWENLHRLETEYGILTCEKSNGDIVYQWDYPNGWACLQYIVIIALKNYGYIDDAKRIAVKYTKLVDSIFEKTGNLWEKYNVVEGNISVSNEYEMPTMMGWSAGVYLAAMDLIEK